MHTCERSASSALRRPRAGGRAPRYELGRERDRAMRAGRRSMRADRGRGRARSRAADGGGVSSGLGVETISDCREKIADQSPERMDGGKHAGRGMDITFCGPRPDDASPRLDLSPGCSRSPLPSGPRGVCMAGARRLRETGPWRLLRGSTNPPWEVGLGFDTIRVWSVRGGARWEGTPRARGRDEARGTPSREQNNG